MNTEDVSESWQGLLDSKDWDYFATFTGREILSLPSCRRLMEIVSRKFCNNSKLFWCAETFHERTGFHLHALIESDYRADAIWEWWFERFGRARILLYDPKIGGTGYVSKYVTKQLADYDFLLGRNMQAGFNIKK